MSLPLSFYQEEDVVSLSKKLLGKVLITEYEGKKTAGMIVETEAYSGPEDRASHAYQNRKTPRNANMFEMGGIAYIYQCYGIHSLFNVVTNKEGIPHAILIRAIEPLIGQEIMLERRNKSKVDPTLTNGPGSLSKALGINKSHNGLCLRTSSITIVNKMTYSENEILSSPRVGIDYAGRDAILPWRFRIKDNPWTSRVK